MYFEIWNVFSFVFFVIVLFRFLHTQILRGVHPMKSCNFIDLVYRFLYWVCILNFGVCSVFEFLAYEGMKGTTNPAVVDLSPYGFVFKEVSLQTFILH